MEMKSEEWKACHVRQSQYFLQIVKCTDPRCCSNFQSSYLKVVPKRFLPPPLPVVHTRNGIEWAKDDKDATYLSLYQNIFLQIALMSAQATEKFPKGIPYDYSCPSVDQDMIKRRMWYHCAACRQRELLCVMAFQEMEWALIKVDAEDIGLLNVTDDENESEFGTPVFDTVEVVPIWSDETEDCVY